MINQRESILAMIHLCHIALIAFTDKMSLIRIHKLFEFIVNFINAGYKRNCRYQKFYLRSLKKRSSQIVPGWMHDRRMNPAIERCCKIRETSKCKIQNCSMIRERTRDNRASQGARG